MKKEPEKRQKRVQKPEKTTLFPSVKTKRRMSRSYPAS